MRFSEICLLEAYADAGGEEIITEAEFRLGQMRVKAMLDLKTTFESVLKFVGSKIDGVSNLQISDFKFDRNKVIVYFTMVSTKKPERDKYGEPVKFTQSEIMNNLINAAKKTNLPLYSMG